MRLRDALQIMMRLGHQVHVVLSETLLNWLSGEEIAQLLGMAASVVCVSGRPVLDDQLSGCLEGVVVALDGQEASRMHGLLSWRGSHHNSKVAICLEEISGCIQGLDRERDFLVASAEEMLLPDLQEKLNGHGLDRVSLAVGLRECGARVGVFRTHACIGECHE